MWQIKLNWNIQDAKSSPAASASLYNHFRTCPPFWPKDDALKILWWCLEWFKSYCVDRQQTNRHCWKQYNRRYAGDVITSRCYSYDVDDHSHRRREGSGVRAHCPPSPKKNPKKYLFFGQLLCNIRAFFGQKSCKIREFY